MATWLFLFSIVCTFFFQHTLFTEPEDEIIYRDYFTDELVSVRDKSVTVLRIINKLRDRLIELNDSEESIGLSWFKLKKTVHWLHRLYRVLYALLECYRISPNTKSTYHNLIYGPRSMEANAFLFQHFICLVLTKVSQAQQMAKSILHPSFLDRLTFGFVKMNTSADNLFTMLWYSVDYIDTDGCPLTVEVNCWN